MDNEANILSLDDLDIEEITLLPSDLFDKKSSIESAKSILQRINDEEYDYRYKAIDLSYENNKWIIYYETQQNHVYLKFDDIKHYFIFTNHNVSNEIIDVIKCWASEILRNHSPRVASAYLSNLKRVISLTNGFSLNKLDNFIDMVNDRTLLIDGEEKLLGEHALYKLMTSISIFNDYYPIPEINSYVDAFTRIRKPKIDKAFRNIPSSKDVYRFAYYLDLWRKQTDNNGDKDELIYYFPVYLWWKLTSVIPMRPSEFANLDSKCVFIEDGKTYIKLPRGKEKNHKKVQIPDVLMISNKLYDEICLYKELTKDKGYSETLISYRAISNNQKYRGNWSPKLNKDKTNYDVFSNLLDNFYADILSGKYGLIIFENEFKSDEENTNSIDKPNMIQRKLRPHDSRHIAIVSLMLQGYDKIEIARLAGHTNLTDQYDYYNHVRFWVDSEVKRLSEEYDLRNSYDLDNYIPTSFEANEKFESFFLNSWTNSDKNKHHKLKLGYCSDEGMSCPNGFRPEFSGCYHCTPHWGIDFEELSAFSEVIIGEISVATDNLNKCTEFLLEIHQRANMGITGDVNADLKNNIKSAATKVKSEIVTVAKLQQINNLLQ